MFTIPAIGIPSLGPLGTISNKTEEKPKKAGNFFVEVTPGRRNNFS